jgi:hypothetical protein
VSEIQDFVGNAHGDIDAVRTALAAEPAHANGDWETPIGPRGIPLRAHAAGDAQRVLEFLDLG